MWTRTGVFIPWFAKDRSKKRCFMSSCLMDFHLLWELHTSCHLVPPFVGQLDEVHAFEKRPLGEEVFGAHLGWHLQNASHVRVRLLEEFKKKQGLRNKPWGL